MRLSETLDATRGERERIEMRHSTRDDYEHKVARVERVIRARLSEDVAPEALAREAALSLHHFHRVFRGLRGETLMGFVRRLRLERAARVLRNSNRGVLEIALEAQYGSHEAFTRAFSDWFGVTPSAYRAGATLHERSPCVWEPPVREVVVRDEPRRVGVARTHMGSYGDVSRVWDELAHWYLKQRETETLPPMFALVPDDASITPEERLRYHAFLECELTAKQKAAAMSGTTPCEIPAGKYAVAVHEGAYATLVETYQALIGGWFPNSGYALAAEPVVERYLNSPREVAEPELRTEVWVRIEERGWLV